MGDLTPAFRSVRLLRVDGVQRDERDDLAVVEEPLQILVNGTPFTVIMRTPGTDRDLAAGFLLGERIVVQPGELHDVVARRSKQGLPHHNVVDALLAPAAVARVDLVARRVTTTASCGLCGRQVIESLTSDGLQVHSDLRVEASRLADFPAVMRKAQRVFDRTGGLHAAALMTAAGEVVQAAEDVGRHNAVDKVVGGRWWAKDWPLANYVLCVSGRTSFEIIQKAAVAGVPVVVAVSAPSTLAIDLAQQTGVTLAGFARDGRVNVYANPARVIPAESRRPWGTQ